MTFNTKNILTCLYSPKIIMMKHLIKYIYLFILMLVSLSAYTQVSNPVLLVTRTDDFNPNLWDANNPNDPIYQGTLRWAVFVAESTPGSDVIKFNSVSTIKLDYVIDNITSDLTIDGTGVPGYDFTNNMVTIQSNTTRLDECILTYFSNNLKIKGIHLNYFKSYGVLLYNASNSEIDELYITDIGETSFPGVGIEIYSCDHVTINNSLFDNYILNTNFNTGVLIYDDVFNGAVGGPSTNNLVKNCTFKNFNSVGIEITEGTTNDYNRLEQNLFFNNTTGAILFNGSGGTANLSKSTPAISSAYQNGVVAGTADANDVVDIYGASQNQNAEQLIGTVSADANGNWSYSSNLLSNYTYVSVQSRDFDGKYSPNLENSSMLISAPLTQCVTSNCATPIQLSSTYEYNNDCQVCAALNTSQLYYIFETTSANFTFLLSTLPSANGTTYNFNYAVAPYNPSSDYCTLQFSTVAILGGTVSSTENVTIPTAGTYILKLSNMADCPHFLISLDNDACETCIGSFAPIPGNDYMLGAWSAEGPYDPTKITFTYPEIYVHFTLNDATTTSIGPLTPSGAIIDGWQRIEEKVSIPINAVDITIELTSTSGDVYYDDVRMFPVDGSMKSFVYDPVNMRLHAELDERHYATFYEYDEEGKLVRIKKETERGVMTIQETKSNSSK